VVEERLTNDSYFQSFQNLVAYLVSTNCSFYASSLSLTNINSSDDEIPAKLEMNTSTISCLFMDSQVATCIISKKELQFYS